jgi:hypothetical protein
MDIRGCPNDELEGICRFCPTPVFSTEVEVVWTAVDIGDVLGVGDHDSCSDFPFLLKAMVWVLPSVSVLGVRESAGFPSLEPSVGSFIEEACGERECWRVTASVSKPLARWPSGELSLGCEGSHF